jgi:NTE family protein
MRAFVLSGGANYGALQAGALTALLEHGFFPDMLVGVSAGALNAAWLAAQPTLAGARLLERIWCESAPKFFPPLSHLSMLYRLVQGKDSLLANDSLQRFIRKWSPGLSTFGDFKETRLYVLAARLTDGAPRFFGDDPGDRLLDGLMASTALPPLFPPWEVDGEAYVDGGTYSDLPLQAAVERGATEIIALQITHSPTNGGPGAPKGLLGIASRALAVTIDRTVDFEIQAIQNLRHVPLHLIHLWPGTDPGFWDFSQAAELIADGHQAAEEYLERSDLRVSRRTPWLRRLQMRRVRIPKRNPNPSNHSIRLERASSEAGWRRPGAYGQQ